MTDTVFTTTNVSFWRRVRKQVLVTALLVAVAMSVVYSPAAGEIQFFWLAVIVLIGIICVLGMLENARVVVNEIRIDDHKIIVGGCNYNSPWVEEFDLARSEISITEGKEMTVLMTCSLKIVSAGRAVLLAGSWDYRTRAAIFRELKRAKGERISSQEEHFLARMERSDEAHKT